MKYCLQILGLYIALSTIVYSSQAQSTPDARTQSGPEDCGNGIDDDGDKKIDCADFDSCSSLPRCSDESINCSDGLDNDGDGDVDCADSECDCTGQEICNNGIDDDGDGLFDCYDGDCDNFVGCENECNNGVDDDGDGFFDYYDGDCLDEPGNPNDFIIIKPECEARPQGNVFDINEAWRSNDGTASSRGIPIIADIDSDGTPEVISNNENNKIMVMNGIDGTIEREVSYTSDLATDTYNNSHLAVGEIDNDGYGEIFHLEQNGWIRAFNHDLSPIWKVRSAMRAKRPPLLADFNNDGKAELYFGNEIRDALTGNEIIRGSDGSNIYPSGNNWKTELNGYPVAVDILPSSACATCDGLELVLGHIIYAVDIKNGQLTEAKTMDDVATKINYTGDYYPKDPGSSWKGQNFSSTAVVDFNGDGNLDILMSGATGSHNGPSTVFLWDLANDRAKAFVVTRPATEFDADANVDIRVNFRDLNGGACNGTDLCTWVRGVGSLNVANIDNPITDPGLECTFMSGSSLYAIDNNMELKWANHSDFWESTSGVTGTAVFDFDGDGASEVIYRDQVNLYIVNGENGEILNSQYGILDKCSSQTTDEYPVIADVDGDGETELVVTCGKYENERGKGSNNEKATNRESHIRAYKAAAGQFWVPSRRIWNQYTYFNVNVNDNLTIPRYQQPHHLNFSQICNTPNAANRFSLNKFLNQSPRITFCGDLAFPAARLDFADDGVKIFAPVCPEDSFEVRLSFKNTGDYTINQPIPFAFYAQDPKQSYGNTDPSPWLDTLYISKPEGIRKGQQVDTTVMVRGARGQFTLYVSMNDIGPFDKETKAPIDNASFYPLTTLNGTVRECDGTPTVVSKPVNPIPFEMIVTASDNRRCPNANDIGEDNGSIKITDKNGSPLTPLGNYQVSLTNTRTNTVVDISSSLADLDAGTFILGLDSGTYAVSASYQNSAFSCGSIIDTVTINRIDSWPGNEVLTIEKIKDVSSCKPKTADGEARVLVNGVLPDEETYEVTWLNEQDSQEKLVGASVTNLKPFTYRISVFNKTTGCTLSDSTLRMDLPLPVQADPVVTHATRCDTPNGSITAQMQQGNIADFDFQLIQKSPMQGTTVNDNGVFTGLSEGIYEIKAFNPTNDCGLYSEGIIVTIENNATLPDVTLTQVSPQTACDPALVNGRLRATPGTPGTYTYTWYKGTVTTGPTADTVGITADATELSTYGNPSQLFTVVILDGATGCTLSDTVRLFEQISYPKIDPVDVSVTPRTKCDTPNGGIRVSMGGTTTNYKFQLYKGTNTNTPIGGVSTDGIFTGLDSIEYSIVAIAETGCATPDTSIYTVKVPGNTAPPTVIVTSKVNQSSCDDTTPNGAISVTADGSTSTANYTFVWEDEAGNSYGNTASIDKLKRGRYQLKVTDNTTGCNTTLSIPIDDEIYEGDDIQMSLSINNVDFCDPYNGRIEVADVVVNGNSTPISDYTFTWYEVTNPGLDSTLVVDESGNAITTSVLNNLTVGMYSVQAFSTVTRCYSTFTHDSVRNDAVQPIIEIDPDDIDPITQCINPEGRFKLKVVLPDGSNALDNYTYDWYLGADTLASNFIQTGQTIENVKATLFTIVATDKATQCQTLATVDLSEGSNILPVITGQPTATHIEVCGPTPADLGTAHSDVNLILGDGDEQSDYVFYWFEGKVPPQLVGGIVGEVDTTKALTSDTDPSKPAARGVNTPGSEGHTLSNLQPGFYTVVAYYPPNQCASTPKTIEILHIARPPMIRLVDNQPDSLCNALTGRLEVEGRKATGDSTVVGTPAYTYAWYQGATVTGTKLNAGNNPFINGVAAGEYTVEVTDDQTGCSATQTFRIREKRNMPVVMSARPSHKNECLVDNGIITVDQIGSGNTTLLLSTDEATFESDYHFYLYANESDYDSSNPTSNTIAYHLAGTADNYQFTALETGTYFVAVQHQASGCLSPFLREVVIKDETPMMTLAPNGQEDFITCTALNEGELSAKVGLGNGISVSDVEFKWFTGRNNTNPADEIITDVDNTTAGFSKISNLVAGDYTVQAIDMTGQACPVTAYFTVDNRQLSPVLSVSKLNDQTKCNADGAAQIKHIVHGVDEETLSDYSFVWYLETIDLSGRDDFALLYGSYDATSYSNLLAGTYFVQATQNFGEGCITNIEQVTITDQSTVLQVIDAFISDPIVACDPSNFNEGEIEIKVFNSTNFITRWYRGSQIDENQRFVGRVENGITVSLDSISIGGSTTDSLLIANANNPAVNDTLQALPPGIYTVAVIENDTGCEAIRQYTIQGIPVPLAAFPSSRPQISCIADDGAVGVTINGGSDSYIVNWYAGTNTSGNPINAFGSYFVEDVSSGIYTVVVTDKYEPSCGTVTEQVTVLDRRGNNLDITVDADFPMTNCDEANPNGQLNAEIEGELFRYEFFWYEGNNTTGNPIAYGPTATNLGENTYTVVARDRITGCLSNPYTGKVVTLLDSGLLPAPTVRMLSPVTRCTNPNGSAEAILDSTLTVDPNIDYEFIWYNATEEMVFSSSRTNVASQLDTGTYSVVVRNTITGCLSAPGEVYISDDIYIPEFDIVTTPSFCNEPSGTLSLVLNEPFNVVNIEWATPYGFNNGFFLDNQPAGKYVATLTDANGCQIIREAYVIPGIQVYNAVSPNGDQKNDIFTISCIGDFENNIVRIYNRAGSLVYEHEGYDNETIFFHGYGNRGIYVGQKELPDGTYFYIVDKRNGDEPESGYLELLR